jgi:hypothetical protein
MTVDLSPIWAQVLPLVGTIIGLVGTWAIALLAGWLKAHMSFVNAQTQAALQVQLDAGLQNAINYGEAQALKEAPASVPVNSLVAKIGADYAVGHFPDLLKSLGASDPAVVAQKIEARIQGRANDAAVQAATAEASAPTVTVTAPTQPEVKQAAIEGR